MKKSLILLAIVACGLPTGSTVAADGALETAKTVGTGLLSALGAAGTMCKDNPKGCATFGAFATAAGAYAGNWWAGDANAHKAAVKRAHELVKRKDKEINDLKLAHEEELQKTRMECVKKKSEIQNGQLTTIQNATNANAQLQQQLNKLVLERKSFAEIVREPLQLPIGTILDAVRNGNSQTVTGLTAQAENLKQLHGAFGSWSTGFSSRLQAMEQASRDAHAKTHSLLEQVIANQKACAAAAAVAGQQATE